MRILLIEDDRPAGSALAEILISQHYKVDLATDGQAGLALAETQAYDLILLDLMLPKLDGISLCKQLRAQEIQTPILLLTAQDSTSDQVMGLDAGADDYVIKPYDVEALLARLRALKRRGRSLAPAVITWENLQLDPAHSQVTCADQEIRLTPKEYCLLELFFLNPKRIYSRRAILDRLWDFAESPGEETVSTHIKCLRQKLKAAGAADPIETVHGLGYRLRSPRVAEAPPEASPLTSVEQRSQRQKKAKATTDKVWQKFKDKYAEQIIQLDQTVKALLAGELSSAQQHEAQQQAHKLAGSLGIFGWMAASKLAKDLEGLLKLTGLDAMQKQRLLELVQALQREMEQAQTASSAAAAVSESIAYAPLILIVDDDLMLAERIRSEAIAWDLRVEIATDLAVARQIIAQTPPHLILLDLGFPGSSEDGLALLGELSHRTPKIPVLAFTGRTTLADRVEVARLGGCAFLQKPMLPRQILKTITDILQRNSTASKQQILVVDDDPAILSSLSTLLKPWQIEVTPLANPEHFWEVLTATRPNLLVLDLEMPNFSGIELCQVVRSDSQWSNLPILLLSIHEEENLITQAFAAGADDYLYKSMGSAELATRIIRRLPPQLSPNQRMESVGAAEYEKGVESPQ